MALKVCLAGATGWAGSALARGMSGAADLELVAAVSRTHAGRTLGEVLDEPRLSCPVFASVAEALKEPCDVLVEYTRPDCAKSHILTALERGAHVVVGTSGLGEDDFADVHAAALRRGRGVLACGNFAITVVLLQRFAQMAARYIPHWEIIDYASEAKPDAPSGTARELAFRMSRVGKPSLGVSLEKIAGPRESRGATVSGCQVHSVRLPGYVLSAEVIFGLPDQKLTLRHDSGSSAQPYVDGALLAVRKVSTLVGVHRGLDCVLDL